MSTEEKITFRTMLKDKNYAKLLIAGLISRFGDSVDSIAYGYMVFEMTGSAVLIAALFAVNGIPSLIFNLFSGVMVTYMPKKRVVYICDLLRGLVVLLTGFLYFTGGLEVWHLYLFTVLNSTFEAFREPAASVLFVQIVDKDKLEHATSLRSSGRMFAELVGFATAGIFIGLVGVSGAIILDGVTFVLSAMVIFSIIMAKEELTKEKLTIHTYFRDLKEGLSYSLKIPFIRFFIVFAGAFMLFLSPFNALQTPYILEVMDLDVSGISVLCISFMVSMIAGSLFVPKLINKLSARIVFIIGGTVVGLGYFAFGLITVFAGTLSGYVAIALVSVLMGSTVTFIQIPISVAMMKTIDQEMLPRVISTVNVLALSSVPLGAACVGVLVKFVEIRDLFIVFGIMLMMLFLGLLRSPSAKRLNTDDPVKNNELVDEVA